MSREFYAHQRKEKRKTYILVTLAKSSKCKSTRKTTQPNTGKDRVPSMVVDGLIGGGFDGFDLHLLGRSIWLVTGFDRFRLLGRSVWSVAFARFDHLIIWSVDRLMGLIFFSHGFDSYGFGFIVLIFCFDGFAGFQEHACVWTSWWRCWLVQCWWWCTLQRERLMIYSWMKKLLGWWLVLVQVLPKRK